MVRASVIVPARNAEETLPMTLDHLQRQVVDFDYEVIVVDDGSDDRTPEIAESAGEPVRVVREEGSGPAAARNRGVAESHGDVIAFCDADCFPVEEWLATGARALEGADLVQGRVWALPGVDIGPWDRTMWISREVGLWETANMFVTRELFDRVGGFEDWLEPVAGKALAEDAWFGWRAKRLGARTAFCWDALAHHAVFRRRARDYVAEHERRFHFPQFVARMPELRRTLLFGLVFLGPRTAAFDLAVIGVAAALASGRRSPALGAIPYASLVLRRALEFRSVAHKVVVADTAADVVSASALVRGSIRARTLVI